MRSLDHEVLYSGVRPDARMASAHAAATRGPSPRPRNGGAVSSPASAAKLALLAQKQTLTAWPSSSTPTMGDASGISSSVQPVKLASSCRRSSTVSAHPSWGIVSGKVKAGPEPSSPPTSDTYRSAWTGGVRRSEMGGSSRARLSISPAISGATSAWMAHAQPAAPRTSMNAGPRPGLGSTVETMRPSSSNTYLVRRQNSGVPIPM